MKVLSAYVLLALALLLTATGPAAAQDQQSESFVAKVDVTDEAVTFHPEGRYVGFMMQVAGPEDFYLQQRFAGGEVPSLRLKTEAGQLADGSYTIQVTAQPEIPEKAREALLKAREEQDQAQMSRIFKEVGINQRAMIYAMSVGVAEGKFLNPRMEEPAPGGEKGQTGQEGGLGLFNPVLLTPPAPDFAEMSSGPAATAHVAAPDVTRAALNQAIRPVEDEKTLPEFIARLSGPDTHWSQAHFQNTMPDGSNGLFEGWLHPVASDGPDQVFHAFFRRAAQDGNGYGPWIQGYFQGDEGGYTLLAPGEVQRADADEQAPLFDYLADERTDAPEAAPRRDHVINDDCIIIGSMCVGFDCVNGMAFGFDTIVMQENNTRLFFNDTSTSASFPRNDWRWIANDSSNGGADYMALEDATAGRRVFEVRGGAPANSLFVNNAGRIGIKTNSPAVEIDNADGDTPTLRLQQTGASGFTPQTWDVAGNETNFFVRDATNGSTLPFRIRPGAPSSAIDVAGTSGNVRMGSSSDGSLSAAAGIASLFLRRTNGTSSILVEEASASAASRTLLELRNNGVTRFAMYNTSVGAFSAGGWNFEVANTTGNFIYDVPGNATVEFQFQRNGDLRVFNNIFAQNGMQLNVPDYVFEDDYQMLSLKELEAFVKKNRHLPNVPSAEDIKKEGALNMTLMQMRLLEKVEELTLYTIQQQKTIEELEARLKALEKQR